MEQVDPATGQHLRHMAGHRGPPRQGALRREGMKVQPVLEDRPHGNQKMFHVEKSANPETEAAAAVTPEAASHQGRLRAVRRPVVHILRQLIRVHHQVVEAKVEVGAAAEEAGQAGRVDRVAAGSVE